MAQVLWGLAGSLLSNIQFLFAEHQSNATVGDTKCKTVMVLLFQSICASEEDRQPTVSRRGISKHNDKKLCTKLQEGRVGV